MRIFVFKFQPKNTQISHFWSQILTFFFRKILLLGKSEGADLKYGNSFFKIPVQKYPNQAFLVSNLRIYIFAPNFATRQFENLKYDNSIFKLQPSIFKYENSKGFSF